MGNKGRPFYRVVVAKSTAGRNSSFIENLGTYNPILKPTHIEINEDRALHWLMQGAQPTETTAILLNKTGVLDKFFSERPSAKKDYKFLDKRTAATSVKSVMEVPTAKVEEAAPAPAPVEEAPAAVAEAPVAEAAAEEPAVEAAAEEAPAAEAEAAPAEKAAPEATEENA
ncbi:MAG: 30S ribosomal protein S16 [Fimbriimonadaceae bacterium]|nr:30S ribosomal protein S16 [Fimbriimonadaceae bacterium]